MNDINEITYRIAAVRPALDALRFYTATTRGFRDREQGRLAEFLKDVAEAELRDYTPDEVKQWLKTKAGWINTYDYRHGDTSIYQALLEAIPPELLARTKDYVYLIAKGSGRRQIDDAMRARIEAEFSATPCVAPPPPPEDDELPPISLGVRID